MITKNPFATPTSTPSPAGNDPHKNLKRWQLEGGRARKRVEEFSSQLDAARIELEQARQALGERMGDGLDTSAAETVLTQTQEKVRALESALAVAIQKEDAAQTALKRASRVAAIEAEVQVVAHLKSVSLKVDQLLIDLERLVVDELGPSLNDARLILTNSGIRDGELNFLTEGKLLFKQHLLLSVHTLLGKGFVPVNMRKYERWSQCIPDEDFIRSRARPGPTMARPIKGWQVGE